MGKYHSELIMLLNLAFLMKCKYYIINIRRGYVLWQKDFKKKIVIFSLLMRKQYSYCSMQAAQGAILFCEMFHGDPK